MKTIILTEIVNCAPVGAIMLQSFHATHPDKQINIVGTLNDFEELGEIKNHKNNILIDITNDTVLIDKYKNGHQGSAHVFALALLNKFGETFDRFIHVDSDIFFKFESISLLENELNNGYDIVGPLRCYGNNPSGLKGLEAYPDTVSTYFMGINIHKVPKYEFWKMCNYCQGAGHPLGYPVLDFFDGITHAILANGGKIKHLDTYYIGSQNIDGKKKSRYPLNMHMDCGRNLVHMGGVGSGYAVFNNKSFPQKSYADWAIGRWAFFSKQFYDNDIGYNKPAVYTQDGRWCDGGSDDNIRELFYLDVTHEAMSVGGSLENGLQEVYGKTK